MQLTRTEVDLVKGSFQLLDRDTDLAAETVYRHLFLVAPQTRPMFIKDMEEQGTKIMSTLGVVVARLDDWDMLAPSVRDMAMRHLAYGVRPEHYHYLGVAFNAAMKEILGDEFSPDVERAWAKVYGELADFMIETAYPMESYEIDSDPF